MSKLTTKERARYAEAEQHLRSAFGDGVQCTWEVAHPSGAPRIAMLAGFIHGSGLLILQIYRNGDGWEIYAAPQAIKIEPTFDDIKKMWGRTQ